MKGETRVTFDVGVFHDEKRREHEVRCISDVKRKEKHKNKSMFDRL